MGKTLILTLNFEFEIPNLVSFLNLESGTVYLEKNIKSLEKILKDPN